MGWMLRIALPLVLLGCGAEAEPHRDGRETEPTTTPELSTTPAVADDESVVTDPYGTRRPDRRRMALAGCEQTTRSTQTGTVYAVTRYDDGGWPVQRTTYVGDEVATQVDTTYVRDEEGRVVASEAVGVVPAVDTGCDEVTETVATTYDVAQRPVETVTTHEGCGATTEEVRTFVHFVEDERILYTATYDPDGKLVRYVTYDKCSMVKKDDDLRYRSTYDADCTVVLVELRRYGWWWTYEGERPVLFDIEGTDNDTAYTYTGCLSEAE